VSGPASHRFVGKSRYSGYLNAGQPTPWIGLGVYGVAAAAGSRAGTAALAAGFAADFATGFAADFAAAGFFTTGFAALGFFAAFFGTLFFFAVFAMPRNLLHTPSIVKRTISPLSISKKQKGGLGGASRTPQPKNQRQDASIAIFWTPSGCGCVSHPPTKQ
jgi:hypothetical protein